MGVRERGEGRSLYENALGSSVRTTSCAKTDGALGTKCGNGEKVERVYRILKVEIYKKQKLQLER